MPQTSNVSDTDSLGHRSKYCNNAWAALLTYDSPNTEQLKAVRLQDVM